MTSVERDIELAVSRAKVGLLRKIPWFVDIEDVLQEARLEAWRHRGKYDASRSKRTTFFGTIAWRAGLRWIKREARQEALRARKIDAYTMDSDVVADMFLDGLDATTRCMLLDKMAGFNSREIARRRGINWNTVRSRICRLQSIWRGWSDGA